MIQITAAKKNRATIISEKSPTFPSGRPLQAMSTTMNKLIGKQFLTSKRSIKSLSEYFDLVEESKRILNTPEIWYRGQSSVTYELTPNIYRLDDYYNTPQN